MDRETLSQYGWIIICIVILMMMIGLASPFAAYFKYSLPEILGVIPSISTNEGKEDKPDVKEYVITYDANGGSCDIKTQEIVEGGSYQLPSANRVAYRLDGWYDGDTKVADTDLTNVKANKTLVAHWIVTSYEMSFETNGGSKIEPVIYDYGATTKAPNIPAKAGCTFDGWYADIECNEEYQFTTMPARDVTVYADWTVNNYTLIFDANGGACDVKSIVLKSGDQYTLPLATKVGYNLTGWTDDTNTYSAGDKVTVTDNKTYKAIWTAGKYTMSFNTSGGTEIAPVTYSYGDKTSAPAEPSLEGYKFVGWYSDIECNNPYDFTTMPARDVIIYADWNEPHADVKIVVTFDANGGSCSKTSAEYLYGSTYGELPTATRVGYSFDGWFTEKNGGTQITSDTQIVSETEFTVYAHWTQASYIVSFNSNGGTACDNIYVPIDSYVMEYEGRIYEINFPTTTKSGSEFYGWTTDDDNYVQSGKDYAYLSGNTTFRAIWQEKLIYTLSDDGTYYIVGDTSSTENSNGLVAGTSASGIVVIPETYNGLPVKKINKYAFAKSGITSITIPESITETDHALILDKNDGYWCYGCSKLTKAKVNSKTVDCYAFAECTALKSLTLYNTHEICNHTFDGCSALSYIHLPDSLNFMGDNCFANTGLTSISVPASVNGGALASSRTLVASTNTVSKWFYNCDKLTSILFDEEMVPSGACMGCDNLTDVTLAGTSIIYTNAFSGCKSLTNIDLPNTLTSIGTGAFTDSGLTSVILPASCTVISGAFKNCDSLTSITVPATVTGNNNEAFYDCDNLASAYIYSGIIETKMFYNCGALTSVYISDNISSISKGAFTGCTNLSSVNVRSGATIYDGAFPSTCTVNRH